MSEEELKDCSFCRLISGGGLLLGGAYVIQQSKNLKKYPQVVAAIGYALGALGILRMFSLPPFRNSQVQKPDKAVDDAEPSDYIIGKYPTKFH